MPLDVTDPVGDRRAGRRPRGRPGRDRPRGSAGGRRRRRWSAPRASPASGRRRRPLPLEGSKAFAKEVMAAAGVATGASVVCSTPDEVAAALDELGSPYVVKDDGLAAGKGVVVTTDRDAALAHAATCARVVVEEYLDGPEVSLFAVTDGTTVLPLSPAQDFKRVHDGDAGPEHRRDGRLLAAAVGAGRAGRGGAARRAAADGRRDGPPRHAVRRAAVRRAGADLARGPGDRVQRPVRRPGDPGRAGPAGHAARRRAARRGHRTAGRGRRRWSGPRARRSRWWWRRTGYPEAPVRRRRGARAGPRGARSTARTCCTPARRSARTATWWSRGGRVLSVVGTGADRRRRPAGGVRGGRTGSRWPARTTAPTSPRPSSADLADLSEWRVAARFRAPDLRHRATRPA